MKIISYAPARISLFGGGTDLTYAEKYGGIVISMAINLYQRIEYFDGEDIYGGYTELPYKVSGDFAYSIFSSYGVGGMHLTRIKTSFDGVIGAGLGSSGSFGVGLIAAIKRARGERINRGQIAQEAIFEENKLWITGRQDQYAAAFGGFNILKFGKMNEVISFDRIIGDQISEYLHLFYTGGQRKSSRKQIGLKTLKTEDKKKLDELKDIALIAQRAIYEGKMELVGKLLHASWEIKRGMGTSTNKINMIYQYARDNGAIGGKLCGAGQSGYMLFMVSPEKSKDFVEKMRLKGLEETDFSIDYQGVNTRIL